VATVRRRVAEDRSVAGAEEPETPHDARLTDRRGRRHGAWTRRGAHPARRTPDAQLSGPQNRHRLHATQGRDQQRPAVVRLKRPARLRGPLSRVRGLHRAGLARYPVGAGAARDGGLSLSVLPGARQRVRETGHGRSGRVASPPGGRAGHAGFRLNALVSLLANASRSKLAAEFVRAKDDSDELQTFVNTILAEGWKAGLDVDELALASRVEPFSLDAI